MSAIGT
jgi:hypothetical protein